VKFARKISVRSASFFSMTKDEIIILLRDVADAEGGDVSLRRFIELSGVGEKQIVGVHWPTWNAAKREAGLRASQFARPRLDEATIVQAFAGLLAELGKWPTESEMRLAKRRDDQIPSTRLLRALVSNGPFLAKLRAHCEADPRLAAVASLVSIRIRELQRRPIDVETAGHVYMMRSGRRYKIGHTSSPSRRHREIRLDLPERTDLVHSIETDDPKGIEAYWHNRFGEKRIRDTEFFELSASDVAAFKKRKFQ
jgi:hypothetical protein